MTTRRDLIKLASALGLAGTVPTVADRMAAAQVLDQHAPTPGAFATHMTNVIIGGSEPFSSDWCRALCPEEYASYTQAFHALDRGVKALGIDPMREYSDYEAETYALVLAMYDAGLRHGAAFEHLRRSVIGERAHCAACQGVGATEREGVCRSCGGYRHGGTEGVGGVAALSGGVH